MRTEGAGALELYIVRHGEAAPGAPGGDHARPLTTAGTARAAELGRRFATVDFDAVLASDATRAQETLAAIRAPHTARWGAARVDRVFYDGGVASWREALLGLPAATRRVLLVGHNPVLSDLASDLDGAMHSLQAGECVIVPVPPGWRDRREA